MSGHSLTLNWQTPGPTEDWLVLVISAGLPDSLAGLLVRNRLDRAGHGELRLNYRYQSQLN